MRIKDLTRKNKKPVVVEGTELVMTETMKKIMESSESSQGWTSFNSVEEALAYCRKI